MVVCDEAEDAIGRGTSQSTEWQARDEHREHCVARSGRAQRMKCVYSCEANGQRVTCSGLAFGGNFHAEAVGMGVACEVQGHNWSGTVTGCIVMCPLAKERVGSHIVGGVRQGFVVAGEELGATRVVKR